MKKAVITISLVSFLLCLFCSCSKDSGDKTIEEETTLDRITGTWIFEQYNHGAFTSKVTVPSNLTLNRDGTFTFKGQKMFPFHNPLNEDLIDVKGTYSYTENPVVLTMIWVYGEKGDTQSETMYLRCLFPENGLVLCGEGIGYSDWTWHFKK